MEAYAKPPLDQLLQDRRIRVLFDCTAVLIAVIAIVILYISFNGYQTLRLEDLPADATVTLNGHTAAVPINKLYPGSYQVLITSPTTNPYTSTLNVSLLHPITFKPILQQRSATAIARSLLGSIPGTSIAPQLTEAQWFASNTWLAGVLAPSNTVFVAHYDHPQKNWTVAFCNSQGYPSNIASLPPEVANYIQPLLTEVE